MSFPLDNPILDSTLEGSEELDLSLLETLDHVLDRGLVIAGEITISVANIDLIFLGLNVLATSIETANEVLLQREMRLADPSAPQPEIQHGVE